MFSVDATKMVTRMGRYINDAPKSNCNSKMVYKVYNGQPRLALYSSEVILANTEIRYDYGAPNLWWRNTYPEFNHPFNLKVGGTLHTNPKPVK